VHDLRAAFKRGTFIGAAHWQGTIVSQVRFDRFFGRTYEIHDGRLRIFNIGTHEWLNVPLDSWVLKMRNGDFIVVSDEVIRLFARLR
jgi:hypothetical protein